ncbi:MAG: ABC transporter substrate-binding protein [Candidatus Tectomicrobia bacterium]|nr:ABC transporter substrate-binding protein [Candidatus Tectomicrobia bacterium]
MTRNNGKKTGLSRREFLALSSGALAGSMIGPPQAAFGNYHHQPVGEPRYGGHVKVGDRGFQPGLDPHRFGSWGGYLMLQGTHQGLIEMGDSVSHHPCLATHWDVSDDVKEWTFYLRRGVKFNTGQEMTSDDVKFSLERAAQPLIGGWNVHRYRSLDKIEAVDKYTLKITWKEPFTPTLDTLRMYSGAIIPKDSAPFDKAMVGGESTPGTGPFYVSEYKGDEIIKIKRNEYYWEKDEQGRPLPYLDEVSIYSMRDDTVRTAALRNDEIQYTLEIAAKDVERFKAQPPGSPKFSDPEGILNKDLGLVIANPLNRSNWCHGYTFNLRKPPFDNLKVRQAVCYAIDKQGLVDGALWGVSGYPIFGTYPDGHPWGHRPPGEDPYAKGNPEKAKQLLTEAGHPNGFRTSIPLTQGSWSTVNDPPMIAKEMLRKVGIEIDVDMLEGAITTTRINDRAFTYINWGLSWSGSGDPDDVYFRMFHSSNDASTNRAGYKNPVFDRLVEESRRTLDKNKRMALFRRMAKMIFIDDLPGTNFFHYASTWAWTKDLKHFWHTYNTSQFFVFRSGMSYGWLDRPKETRSMAEEMDRRKKLNL